MFDIQFAVGHAVRITNLKVPSVYIVNDTDGEANPELVLDCEYEVNSTHPGFVLKWLLNDQPIYQWIGDKLPQPHSVVSDAKNTLPMQFALIT